MKNTIRRLVCATDFSAEGNNAALRGAHLANALGVKDVCLWHVLEPAVGRVLKETLALSLSHRKHFHDQAIEALNTLAKTIEQETGITPDTQFMEGTMTEVLPKSLKAGDLLVIGATGRHHFRRIMMGTTALRILQRCQVPVLVTRQTAASHYRQVLIATDFSPFSQRAAALAQAVAPEARISMVHAYHARHEIDLRFAGCGEEEIQQHRDEAKKQAGQDMQPLLVSYPAFESELLSGYPLPALLGHAEESHADLLVVGKQGKRALDEYRLGEVTQHLLNEAGCDVLVVN